MENYKEIIFNDYKLIKKMKSDIKIKRKLLSHLLTSHSNPWRVIGITKDALEKFKNHDFKKVPRMGINRSHIISRADTYDQILNSEFKSFDELWDYYYSRDTCVLATSSENMKKQKLNKVFDIDESFQLFKNQGYAWKHGKNEIEFLRNLYKKASQV